MKTIFIAPHPDDECLWGAYTIQRELPLVYVVRIRSEIWRCDESREAMAYLGLPVENLIFIDTLDQLPLPETVDKVYAPAMQGGHPFHDVVCKSAILKYGAKVIFYSTYGKDKTESPFGRWKVEATERQIKRKKEALVYYESQHRISAAHFNIPCKDEYYF